MTVVLRTVAEVRAWRRALPAGQTVGFVPTMGALHAGHISLMELAKGRADGDHCQHFRQSAAVRAQ